MKSWFTISNLAAAPAAEIDIFDEIGLWGVTVKDFATALKAIPVDRDITVRINSPGGSVFDGFAIFNLLRARKDKVACHVIGLAASMASIIMLAGKSTTAAANATIMIHKPSGAAWGESDDMREMADLLDKLEGTLVNTYAAKTGKKEKEIEAAMAATTWFTADEAHAWGLVDEITEAVKVAACHDLSRFGALPAKFTGGPTASTNKQPNETKPMKALLTALVAAKFIASSDASEDTAVAQFTAASAHSAQALKDAQDKATDLQAKLDAANAKLAATLKASAENAVADAVKAGRVKDDKDVRAKWVEAYVRDEAGTKAMLDSLPETKGRGNPPVNTNLGEKTPEARESTRAVWARQFSRS